MPKVIILAAGGGSRLKPYTNTRPKSLIEFGGQSLIERQIDVCKSCGLDDICIVGGFMKEKIAALGYPWLTNEDWSTTNMVKTLWCAFKELESDVVVSYADIVYQKSVLQVLLNSESDCSVVVDEGFKVYWEERFKDPLADAESLSISSDGCIKSIGQKISSLDEAQAQYIGLMRFKAEGLKRLKDYMSSISSTERFTKMYMTDLLQDLINSGVCLKAVGIKHGWLEFDNLKDYECAKEWLENGTLAKYYNISS